MGRLVSLKWLKIQKKVINTAYSYVTFTHFIFANGTSFMGALINAVLHFLYQYWCVIINTRRYNRILLCYVPLAHETDKALKAGNKNLCNIVLLIACELCGRYFIFYISISSYTLWKLWRWNLLLLYVPAIFLDSLICN